MFPSPPSSPVPLFYQQQYAPPPLTPPPPPLSPHVYYATATATANANAADPQMMTMTSAFVPIPSSISALRRPRPHPQVEENGDGDDDAEHHQNGSSPLSPLSEWVEMLKPSWKYLSLFSNTADLISFAKQCSATGYTPRMFRKDPEAEHISQVLNISLEDSVVVVLAIRWNRKHIPESVLHRLQVESLGVKEKNYVREYTKADTFEGIVIATSGPKAVLAAEQQIHSVILFPIAFFLGMSLSNLTGVKSDQADTRLGTAALSISVVNFLLYTFTIINSITQSVIISYASLTDYACAYYLSKKLFIRLSDVITFCISLLILTPLEITLNLYNGTGYNYAIFWVWIGFAVFFITSTILYNGVVIFNARSLYENRDGDDENDDDVDGIGGGVGRRFRRFNLKNIVDLKNFESHMQAIGSWRKRDYAESYWRSSIANVFAERALKIKKA